MAVREREEQKIMLEIQRENRKKIKQQKALENYEKHYSIAMGMIKEIVNLSTKIGEYRELTEGSVPNTHMYIYCTSIIIHVHCTCTCKIIMNMYMYTW